MNRTRLRRCFSALGQAGEAYIFAMVSTFICDAHPYLSVVIVLVSARSGVEALSTAVTAHVTH